MTAAGRPHRHLPDPAVGRDWSGQTFCTVCGLPRTNKRHEFTPPPDIGPRILGERIDLEDE